MSDINITVNDEIVNIDIVDEPVLVNVVNSPGVPGAPGQGVPVGGTTGQVLKKLSNTNYDTYWAIDAGGISSIGLTMPAAFNVANSPLTANGTLAVTGAGSTTQYIDGTGALQTFPLSLPVLQEVRNQTGATLDAGTVVYINGATGNKPTVTKAIATGDATSAQTLGMVSASIANNGTGYVVVIGTCSGLDTSAFTEGQQLYLSYTTAGAVTTTKPYAPYHLVYIGIVTRAHPTLGTVEVRVQNGYELDEIHDVDALNPNNNDGIFYNSSTSLWEHKQISTALGYTPANAATTLTINGVTYDLSANRSWTVSAGISGSGASGQVAYWTGASAQSGSNNLFWDSANGRLGIGTNVPTDLLSLKGSSTFASIALETTGYATKSYIGNYQGRFYQFGSNRRIDGFISNASAAVAYVNVFADNGVGHVTLVATNTNNVDGNNVLRAWGSGNVTIQNGGTFTDSGERLQVTGTMKVTGASSFGGNMTLEINQNASTLLTIRNSTSGTSASPILNLSGSNGNFQFVKRSSLSTAFKFFAINDAAIFNDAGGDIGILNDNASGTIKFAAGGSSTAHMTIKSNGRINMSSLPTSSTGLATGDLWNDAGTIKIV